MFIKYFFLRGPGLYQILFVSCPSLYQIFLYVGLLFIAVNLSLDFIFTAFCIEKSDQDWSDLTD